MAQEGEPGAHARKLRHKTHELDRVAESLLGIDDNAATSERFAFPLRRVQLGPVKTAIGDEPAVLEVAPAFRETAREQQRRTAMVVRLVILGIGGDGGII